MEIVDIKNLLDSADTKELEANAIRWEAAEAIAGKLDEGMTQMDLADSIGRNQSFVSRYAKVWDMFGQDFSEGADLVFSECMSQVRAPRPPSPEPKPEPSEIPEPEGLRHAPSVEVPVPADVKAAHVATEEVLAPIKAALTDFRNSMNRMGVVCAIELLEEAAQELRDALEVDPVQIDPESLASLYSSIGDVSALAMELESKNQWVQVPDDLSGLI